MELKQPTRPDLESLVALFYPDSAELGSLEPTDAGDVPSVYRRLLDHNHHMTVAVEEFHGTSVDVRVMDVITSPASYSRKILLTRHSDEQVVQFGIVRLKLSVLEPSVQEQIKGQQTPLGRILIDNNVMRQVALHQLLRVQCGPDLATILNASDGTTTYGRTALIYCNGEPAVELLEIVAPVSPSQGSE